MSGRTAAPFPPASLSGEGLEGWVAAVTAILKSAGFSVRAGCARRLYFCPCDSLSSISI